MLVIWFIFVWKKILTKWKKILNPQMTCTPYKEDDGGWESALIYICTYRKTKQSIHLYTELHHTNARAGTHEL